MSDRLDRVREMSPADFQNEMRRFADRMGGESAPQYQQFVGFMNQVRAMPHSQYVTQRDQLATQWLTRGGRFGSTPGGTEDAMNAFVDRYLLSPRAPVVIDDRLRSQ